MTPTVADLEVARGEVVRERHRRRYVGDARAWVAECVWTVDEPDSRSPVKPFPVAVCIECARYLGHGDRAACPGCGQRPTAMTYLETLARQWQSADPALLLVPKARRMKLTWLFCAVHTWLACVRPYVNVFLVSSKEQKSIELLDRVEGILVRCPRDRYRPPTWTRQQDLLTLENGRACGPSPKAPTSSGSTPRPPSSRTRSARGPGRARRSRRCAPAPKAGGG